MTTEQRNDLGSIGPRHLSAVHSAAASLDIGRSPHAGQCNAQMGSVAIALMPRFVLFDSLGRDLYRVDGFEPGRPVEVQLVVLAQDEYSGLGALVLDDLTQESSL